MDEKAERQERVILFTEAAMVDIAGIDNATAATWGEIQAERYLRFILAIFTSLSENPGLGSPVKRWPEYLVYTAKYSRKRSSQGHKIFYRVIERGIRIIRVLHTAMNWPEHL